MALERRSFADRARDLLQTLLEMLMPWPKARLSPKITPAWSAKQAADEDAFTLLQTLLDTPLAAGDERRRPVALHSVDPQRYPTLRRPAATRFDTLLQRSSQVLLVGSVLVLGYWFVNVPLSNWLHKRDAPTVRAAGALPSAAAMRGFPIRVLPTKATIRVADATPALGQSASQSDIGILQQRASAIPSAASTEAPTAVPPATEPIAASQQIASPALAVDVSPTVIPTQTASPLIPSPTMLLQSPTMTPVQLGTVSKPSPVPVQRAPVIPAGPRAASALPTRLIIPALGLDIPIKEVFIVGGKWEIAEYAAGYLNGSGRPGVPGNLALSGHAGLYGAVFASLGALGPGDDIYVDAAGVRYRYRLRRSSAVWPNQADVLDSTETPTMTLITCTNWDTQRLVAQADFVDSGPALDG